MIKTENNGYNVLAERAIERNCKRYNMSYDELMELIYNTLTSHKVIKQMIKKHYAKVEVIGTHIYVNFKPCMLIFKNEKKHSTQVIADILNCYFYGMTLTTTDKVSNNKDIQGWCTYTEYSFVSPSFFRIPNKYKQTHTRQEVRKLYQ